MMSEYDHPSNRLCHFLKSHSFWLLFLLLCFSCSKEKNNRADLPEVPEGYSVEIAAGPDKLDFPMFSTLDETGRLFVFESTGNVYEKSKDAIEAPKFRIKLLEDTNEDGQYDKTTVFADKVGFPQGGVFYKGSLYASSAPDLLKFTDTDGDGVADKREVILSGWILNVNANSLVGPFMGPDGWLYMTNAIMGFDVTTKEGKRLKGETARIWRVRPDGSGLEWIAAGGMNNPVELTFTEAGEVIGTETYFTDPKAGQRDALVYWTEGGVYPKPNRNIDRDKLVRTGELMPVITKFSRVTPAGITRYRSAAWGGDFTNNLFSAQFNTHRVMRHIVSREGASFKTEDEVFFSVHNEDFHPTDVLEDADGSLLIVETGGWFIKGCPLSQVSKPELKGAIYRVIKKDAKKADDPYGNKISWKTLQPEEACRYLEDSRIFVKDRAQQVLVDQGASAISYLKELGVKSSDPSVRTKIIFTLYRIGSPEAMEQVRALGLSDQSADVKIAAIRSLGLMHDSTAVQRLNELVIKDSSPAVRRQAATALGQINDQRAVAALLSAAQGTEDRFIRHAIIYALILLKSDIAVKKSMMDSSALVQEAALIALDQMNSPALHPANITRFLTGNNEMLRNTALWVASHHPDWSGEMIGFLRGRPGKDQLNKVEEKLYSELIVSFCEKEDMQRFIAAGVKNGSTEYRLFLLEAMGKCSLKEFPGLWTEQLKRLLGSSTEPQVKAAAMQLASLRGITALNENVRQVAEDKNNPAFLRIDAIAQLHKSQHELSAKEFEYLYEVLRTEKEAPLRQKAAYAFGQAKLSEDQLKRLTDEYLPEADAFILPHLVPLYAGAYSASIGNALASCPLPIKGIGWIYGGRTSKNF